DGAADQTRSRYKLHQRISGSGRLRGPRVLYEIRVDYYTEGLSRKPNIIKVMEGDNMRKVVRTMEAPQPRGPYSQAIVSDGLVFVAGQACVNPKTNELEFGDIQAETRRTLQNIRAILEAAG